VIRRHIYAQCLDRHLRNEHIEPLFFSLSPKKTHGNQYGLLEWNNETRIDELGNIFIDKVLNFMPKKPLFNDAFIEEATEIKRNSIIKTNYRRTVYTLQALSNANYLCEYNKDHKTFIRKSNGTNYTEAHHLIPLCYQSDFKYMLDVPANIISLCSNCHNMLHYGKDIKHVLQKLYSERIELLKKYKIECTFEKLCEYYGVKYDE
jgi:hypothetical protein